MSTDFGSVADDFFVNLSLQTTLALPDSRETILHFCEAVQKEFHGMTSFYQRDSGEYVLEGDRDSGTYQWLELHNRRITTGDFNPKSLESAYHLHKWILDRSVYFLGVSGLDVECLDILLGFNLDCNGNRDAVVAEALLAGSAMGSLWQFGNARPLECEPALVVSLDQDCYLQARLSLETRSSSYQVRTGNYEEEPISVYFTIRRYPTPGKLMNIQESFARQCEACEELAERIIIPNVVHPIAAAIASSGH